VSLFFVVTPGAKTRERIRTHNGSKHVKSGKDVPFGGSVNNGHPTPTRPKFWKFCITKAIFHSKHV